MRMWIDSNTKRYVPVDEVDFLQSCLSSDTLLFPYQDLVIGIVVDKRTEDYRLDVRGPR